MDSETKGRVSRELRHFIKKTPTKHLKAVLIPLGDIHILASAHNANGVLCILGALCSIIENTL